MQLQTKRYAGRTSSLSWDISWSVSSGEETSRLMEAPSSPRQTCSHRSPGGHAAGTTLTHPAVGRLVHVPFYFLSVGHQVLHAAILQGCRVRCREDGLDTERTARTLNLLLVQCQHPAISGVTQERRNAVYWAQYIAERPPISCLVHAQSLSGDNADLPIYPQSNTTIFCY